ncbi:glycosyl transferase family 1 [Opitutaceae bacterium EW11]|nr:glycosyl transferase family 1 [Opitutaceae bacterium EW11]
MMTNTYLPHVGGVARSVSTFAEEYTRRGHRVLVVAPEFEGKPLPKRAEALVERVPAIQKFNGSDFSVRLPIATVMSERLDVFPADVVHAHHPFLLGDTALRIAASKNVPVIFTHHTKYEDYTHYVPFNSPALREFAINLSTHFANLCDGVIAPSESIADLIKSRGVEVPIRVVPTGIDVKLFSSGDRERFRRKYGFGDDILVVGHVGRLAPEKNLEYLAEAVAQYVASQPSARFFVVGAGPSEDVLKEAFTRRGIAKSLVMAGKLTGPALVAAYRAMDVFAFASKSETQGMVLAEAMAAGLPVVALDASGVREVVRHGRNGYLLPEDASPRRFASYLKRLHLNPRRRAAFVAQAARTAETFSREHCAEQALAFYDEILRATRRDRLLNWLNPWGVMLERLNVEWNLLAQKAQSVVEAVTASSEQKAS